MFMEIELKALDFNLAHTSTNFFFLFFLSIFSPNAVPLSTLTCLKLSPPGFGQIGAWVVGFLHCRGGETRPISTFIA